MGTLRSFTDHTGLVVNGTALGVPNLCECDPTVFSWDDGSLPNGEIVDGEIILDEASI
jgi:hypothetical protein